MHLTIAVLPDDVVGPVAIHITGAHEMPVAVHRGEDVDTSLAHAVEHWPVMYLAVTVLPDDVIGSIHRGPQVAVAETCSGIRTTGGETAAVGVDANGNIATARHQHRAAGIAALCVHRIAQPRQRAADHMLPQRTIVGLLRLVLGITGGRRAKVGRGPIHAIADNLDIGRVSGVGEPERAALCGMGQ